MDPILNNLFDKSKAAFIRFHTTKRVNNPILYERYECYREKLKSEGKNPQETYGFIQLPNGDKGEVYLNMYCLHCLCCFRTKNCVHMVLESECITEVN